MDGEHTGIIGRHDVMEMLNTANSYMLLNTSIPSFILPFRILYYFRSVPVRSVEYTPPIMYADGRRFAL